MMLVVLDSIHVSRISLFTRCIRHHHSIRYLKKTELLAAIEKK